MCLATAAGCGRGDTGAASDAQDPGTPMPEIARDLATLAEARVYFNHQSVGFNILHGVERLGKVPITEARLDQPATLAGKGIVHTTIGRNTEPLTKIEGFKKALEAMP